MSEPQSQETLLLGCKCVWSNFSTPDAQLEVAHQRCGHSYLPPTAITSYESLLVKLFLNLNALIIERGDLENTILSLCEKLHRSTKGEIQLEFDLLHAATLPMYRCRYRKCDAEQPTLLQYLLQLVRDYPSSQEKFHALTKIYLEAAPDELGDLLESFNNMMQGDFFTPTYNFKYLKLLLKQRPQLCRNLLFLWHSSKEEFCQGLETQLRQLSIAEDKRSKLLSILEARSKSKVDSSAVTSEADATTPHTPTSRTSKAAKKFAAKRGQGFTFDEAKVYMDIAPEFLFELATLLQRLNTELICNWKYYRSAHGATPNYFSDIKNVRKLWSVRTQGYLTTYVLLRLYSLETNPHICSDDSLVFAHLQNIIDSLGKLQSVGDLLHEVSHELRLDLHKRSTADYVELEREQQAQLLLQPSQLIEEETTALWTACTQELTRQSGGKYSILNSNNQQIRNLIYRVFAAVYNSHANQIERKYKDRNRKLSDRIYLSKESKQRVQECLEIVRELLNEVRRRQ